MNDLSAPVKIYKQRFGPTAKFITVIFTILTPILLFVSYDRKTDISGRETVNINGFGGVAIFLLFTTAILLTLWLAGQYSRFGFSSDHKLIVFRKYGYKQYPPISPSDIIAIGIYNFRGPRLYIVYRGEKGSMIHKSNPYYSYIPEQLLLNQPNAKIVVIPIVLLSDMGFYTEFIALRDSLPKTAYVSQEIQQI